MKEYCIYINIHIDKISQMHYYAMLYNALATLNKYYDNNFDLVIFQYFPSDINFETYKYKSQYSVSLDFDYPKIFQSQYKKNIDLNYYNEELHSPWMSKWYNLYNVYNMGYKKVLMTDCDIAFYKDPYYIFEKYKGQKEIYGIGCCDRIFSKMYPNKHPYMSGQLLFNFENMSIPENFYDLCVAERERQHDFAKTEKNNFSSQELKSFGFFNEQYAPQVVLENLGYSFCPLLPEDYTTPSNSSLENKTGSHVYDIVVDKTGIRIENIKTCIIHYASGCAAYNLPSYLRDSALNMAYESWKDKLK